MFKYEEDVKDLEECPPASARTVSMTAYRFVFQIVEERSFLPVARVSPSRPLKPQDCCAGKAALSMFDCRKKATKFHFEMTKKYKNFAKLSGTHLAEFTIKTDDGLATPSRDDGHFSFFEYKQCDFCPRCVNVKEVSYVDIQ